MGGERYSHEAFQHYAEKTSDVEVRRLLQEIVENKQHHILLLEARLNELGEKPSLPAKAADTLAKLQTSLQGSDDMAMMRRALGDIQTGVVDVYNLMLKLTDPVTVRLLTQIEADLSQYERRFAELYRQRFASAMTKPAKPSTGAVVTAS